MKARIVTVIVGMAMALGIGQTHAMARAPKGDDVKITSRLNTPTITVHGGTVYLNLAVRTPHGRSKDRAPLNLSVVIDRSGSMADDRKMEYAKAALSQLIRQLRPRDILSIVMYDNVIEVLRPADRVREKEDILCLLDHIYPRGSTNLGGGMQEGFRQVSRNIRKGYVNRVILISDGLANQGITSPDRLSRIASKYRNRSISLTSMGVGLSYNEDLMMGLAESGGGNYYFIEHPSMLASVFRNELNMMSQVLAHNVILELDVHPHARLTDVFGYGFEGTSRKYKIPLGDLYYDEERELTLQLELQEGTGSLTLASGELQLSSEDGHHTGSYRFSNKISYTRDVAEMNANRDLDAQAKADVMVSTRKVEEALRALDEGRGEEAKDQIEEAKSLLQASPAAEVGGAAQAAIEAQRQRLNEYEEQIGDDSEGAGRAKKAIQYDNYKTQKKKKN